MNRQQRTGVLSLKVGLAGLVLGLIGFIIWVLGFNSDGTSTPSPTSTTAAGAEHPGVIGALGTVTDVKDNLTPGIATFSNSTMLFVDGSMLRAADVNIGETYDFLYGSYVPANGAGFRDLEVGPDDSVYVSSGAQVLRFDGSKPEIVMGGPGSETPPGTNEAEFRGVTATPDGRVYAADIGNDRVVVRSPRGEISVLDQALTMPNDMATDSHGRPYVADSEGQIFRIERSGELTLVFDVKDARTPAQQMDSGYIFFAFTPHDDLIVSDELNAQIFRQRGSEVWPILGDGRDVTSRDGVGAADASISSPWAVGVTEDNRLLFSESGRLRIVQLDG